MSLETDFPAEFAQFKKAFIQMRVDHDIANGGDGVQVGIDVTDAFAQGWRPPQGFEMWLIARENLKRAQVAEVTVPDGTFFMPFEVDTGDFRITREEAEELAFRSGYRLN